MIEGTSRIVGTGDDGQELMGDAFLAAALTSSSERLRIIGRAAASGYPDALVRWVQSEIEGGTDVPSLLAALGELQVQELASFAAQLLEASGDAAFAKAQADFVREALPEMSANIRERIAQRRSKPAPPPQDGAQS